MAGRYIQVEGCPHVTVMKQSGYNEYKVSYRGLKPDRLEAMAYYTDDLEDAIGTAKTMERSRESQVFDNDISHQGRVHWPDRWAVTRIGSK